MIKRDEGEEKFVRMRENEVDMKEEEEKVKEKIRRNVKSGKTYESKV